MGVPTSCCVVDAFQDRPINFTNRIYHKERTLCENLEGIKWVFQVENEPEHNSKWTTTWLSVLEWPQSSDFSSTGNFKAALTKVCKKSDYKLDYGTTSVRRNPDFISDTGKIVKGLCKFLVEREAHIFHFHKLYKGHGNSAQLNSKTKKKNPRWHSRQISKAKKKKKPLLTHTALLIQVFWNHRDSTPSRPVRTPSADSPQPNNKAAAVTTANSLNAPSGKPAVTWNAIATLNDVVDTAAGTSASSPSSSGHYHIMGKWLQVQQNNHFSKRITDIFLYVLLFTSVVSISCTCQHDCGD